MVAFTGEGGIVIGNGELFVIHELRHQGLSISAIARHTGLDRKTERKYLKQGLQAPRYGPRAPRPYRNAGFDRPGRRRTPSRSSGSRHLPPGTAIGDSTGVNRPVHSVSMWVGEKCELEARSLSTGLGDFWGITACWKAKVRTYAYICSFLLIYEHF